MNPVTQAFISFLIPSSFIRITFSFYFSYVFINLQFLLLLIFILFIMLFVFFFNYFLLYGFCIYNSLFPVNSLIIIIIIF